MIAPVFVDTNVFVYARQPQEALKQPVAAGWVTRLWSEHIGRTSMQTLNECYAVLTRKIEPAESSAEAWDYITDLMDWNPYPVGPDVAWRAREIQLRYALNWWDCLIVASAQIQECSTLLSEDMQDGASYGGVIVRNPFASAVRDVWLPEMYTDSVLPPYRRHRWRVSVAAARAAA
jgi:predicted nucleic acid-binding protein